MINKIAITKIPPKLQRYPTAGDYIYDSATKTLHITISDTGDERDFYALALHEMVESILCHVRGISFDAIDAFDIQHEHDVTAGVEHGEPGVRPDAPYVTEHMAATEYEQKFVKDLNLRWNEYDARVDKAYEAYND
jgi:hypothetical protein